MQNSKVQPKNKKHNPVLHFRQRQNGFTLVELLVVMGIAVVLGTIILNIFFSLFRGTGKIKALTAIRQNGTHATDQMVKMIRFAQSIDDPAQCMTPPDPTPTPTYSSITITAQDGGQTTFSCDPEDLPTTVASNGASLLDTTSVTIDKNECYFTCNRPTLTDFPIVNIHFVLKKVTAGTAQEDQATMPFDASVTMRNFHQ